MARSPFTLARYLAVVQFLLLLTWTVYVVYLPGLLDQVGLSRTWVPWILLLDQLLFALCDIAGGLAADRVFRLHARLGPAVLTASLLSGAAFLGLPWLAGAGLGPIPLLLAIAVWVAGSAALRSPLFGLLARHAARPDTPRLAGLALLGLGLAAALAPYLGTLLTRLDPRLPFALASLTLLLAAAGLIRAERRRVPPASAPAPEIGHPAPTAWRVLTALLLAALAMQIGVFILATPRYLRELPADWLPWVLPVFWIGFSLTVFAGGGLARRRGAARVGAAGCFIGGGGWLLTLWPGPAGALAGQAVAGLGWGLTLASAFGLVADCGRPARVATLTGALFAVLAGAALLRIGIHLAGWPAWPAVRPALELGPFLLGWLGGALLLGPGRRTDARAR